jgi:large subunit ribosomal protein L3
VKTEATDGYSAVQVGYNKTYAAKMNKPELGHLAKSGAPPLRTLQEFRVRRPRCRTRDT